MIWHVLGAGSLGCLWASRLLLAGQKVSLVMRPERLADFQSAGHQLRFTDLQQTTSLIPAHAETADGPASVQRLILACKAYAAAEAVASIGHRLNPGSQVILLQNGIGSQQQVHELLPHCKILVASTTEGAWLQDSFHCVHAGAGQTQFGGLDPHTGPPAWLEQLNEYGIPCQWQPDIQAVLWRKLAINCLINPLTVIHGCRNGELTQYLPRIRLLAGELEQLLQAAGQHGAARDLYTGARQVIESTAANTSSMLQDVQHNRRTEISYITGFALQQARALAVPHPQLQGLHQELQQQLVARGLPQD